LHNFVTKAKILKTDERRHVYTYIRVFFFYLTLFIIKFILTHKLRERVGVKLSRDSYISLR